MYIFSGGVGTFRRAALGFRLRLQVLLCIPTVVILQVCVVIQMTLNALEMFNFIPDIDFELRVPLKSLELFINATSKHNTFT